jgi:hypothetical protein
MLKVGQICYEKIFQFYCNHNFDSLCQQDWILGNHSVSEIFSSPVEMHASSWGGIGIFFQGGSMAYLD